MHKQLLFLFLFILLSSCKDDVLPKPKAYLNLSYPENKYKRAEQLKPYAFDVSTYAEMNILKNYWAKIEYPTLKASLSLTYRPVDKNLKELLLESEKLVFKHTVKAEQIVTQNFVNDHKKVFGTLYEISGNAASQIQFHVTDSTSHFIKGALYFYTKPNYDSILPAVAYIKKDIIRLIESLEWEAKK